MFAHIADPETSQDRTSTSPPKQPKASAPPSTEIASPTPPTKQPEEEELSTPKRSFSLPKPILYLIIAVVVIGIIAVAIFFIYRNSKNEVKNIQNELQYSQQTAEMLKQKLSDTNAELQHMNSLAEQQNLQIEAFKANIDEYENAFKSADRSAVNIDVPQYDIGEQYDENDPGAHKRVEDPRIGEKERIQKMINQKRPTVEDQQREFQQKVEEIDNEANRKIENEIKGVSGNEPINQNVDKQRLIDDEYDEDSDEIIAVLNGSAKNK